MNTRAWLKKISLSIDERGAALITGLLLVLVLTILSLAAMMSTATELKIASNDRSAKQVFYLAESGLEDARSRMQKCSTCPSETRIPDNPTNPDWWAFIGQSDKRVWRGYDSGNSNHFPYGPLYSSTNEGYVATITHKLDASRNILRWGDANGDGVLEENTSVGNNIFVINSYGYTSTGAAKPLQIEATSFPYIDAQAALFTKEHTVISGTSTYVLGEDHCGTRNVPGILTTAAISGTTDPDVRTDGGPTITGAPAPIVLDQNNKTDVQKTIDKFKGFAPPEYTYNQSSFVTTGDWGSPIPGATQQDASRCDTRNVVYFNTNATYVKLKGGSQGCGLLLVEGDLVVEGAFRWYGVILVTGSITFTGGGGDGQYPKNVTGAMLAGGSVSADMVRGDANIVFCSTAVNDQTDNLPLITLRWVELFS